MVSSDAALLDQQLQDLELGYPCLTKIVVGSLTGYEKDVSKLNIAQYVSSG